jgi:hypothetical protein
VQSARALRQHYRDQYLDRCIYWNLRWMSCHQSSILVIIADSMDRAKFAWPRWVGRLSKEMAPFVRPKLVLTAVIAHGWCTMLFLSSELENHGSDAFCEMLVRTLQKVYELSQQSRRPFPQHLVIQSDNTTAQAKNQYACSFLAYLVCTFKFVTVTLNFLMVGHTHEDVDQLFALVLWLLVRKSGFETPAEILQFLKAQLQPYMDGKGSILEAVQITAVRDFCSWLWPLGLALAEAFATRQGIEAPHSFAFKLSSCLTTAERELLEEPAAEGAVYCCVKAYMRSTKLQQPPVLCIPPGRSARVTSESLSPTALVRRRQMGSGEIKSCLTLATLVRNDMPKAYAALRAFVYERSAEVTRFTWLETFAQADMQPRPVTGNVHFPHLPESTWKLVSHISA